MRTAIKILFVLCCFAAAAVGQQSMSSRQIFRTNRLAVVQVIRRDGRGYGVGFLISPDGLVVTANHVATTRKSHFRDFATDIEVEVADAAGRTKLFPAVPVSQTSKYRVNYDTVLLKIPVQGFPYVRMGSWTDVSIGDRITIIPFLPQWCRMVITGTVSQKKQVIYSDLGVSPVDVILFQAPVRNGFSGSPIFDSSGRVVGIVNTKVFGISQTLEKAKQAIAVGESRGKVLITGIDPLAVNSALIDGLDQGLISGLGSGVAIDYAKQIQRTQTKNY